MESDAFKKSLGWLWQYQCLYDFKNKQDFLETYIQNNDYVIENTQQSNDDIEGSLRNYLISTILSLHEMERVLDALDNENSALKLYQSLAEMCIFSANLLSATLIQYEFEQEQPLNFNNHYNVTSHIQVISKILINRIKFDNAIKELGSEFSICMETEYDNLNRKFIIRYIKSYFLLMKIMVTLCIITESPYYEASTKNLSKSILFELRELLYNKRINRVYFSPNIENTHCDKNRTTTKLEVFFSMNNSDRYSFRIDFPHEGVDYIHFNINEPAKKSSSGFPLKSTEIKDVISLCGSKEVFNSLFYFQDDFYWFRSNFAARVKNICGHNKEFEEKLLELQSIRSHRKIGENISKPLVNKFVAAFNVATIEYNIESCPYRILDGTEDKIFQYIIFQDYLFTISVKIQEVHQQCAVCDSQKHIALLEKYVKKRILLYIKEHFDDDSDLSQLVDDASDWKLAEIIEYCLLIIENNIS